MKKNIPNHIGIIPDGNRRFAKVHNIPLRQAYIHGAKIGMDIVRSACLAGVKHLTFFAVSNNNLLKREEVEIDGLRMGIISFCSMLVTSKTQFQLVGEPDEVIDHLMAKFLREQRTKEEFIVHVILDESLKADDVPPINLVIRTGNRHSLSGFLPRQTSFAELYFTEVLWGDFRYALFNESLNWYSKQVQLEGK